MSRSLAVARTTRPMFVVLSTANSAPITTRDMRMTNAR